MIRNIDLLFRLDREVNWMSKVHFRKTMPLQYLRDLPKDQEFDTDTVLDMMKKVSELADEIHAYLEENSESEEKNTGQKLLANLALRGYGYITELLLSSYQKEFLKNLVIGFMVLEKEFQTDMHYDLPSFSEAFYRLKGNHFETLAGININENKFQRLREPKKINDLAVKLLTDPDRYYDLNMIGDFISGLGTRKAHYTEFLFNAFNIMKKQQHLLSEYQEGQKEFSVVLGSLGFDALLYCMETEIQVNLENETIASLLISLKSALDMLYGSKEPPSVLEWLRIICLEQGIEPSNVVGISGYPFDLHIQFQQNLELDDEERGLEFLKYLDFRFGTIFKFANSLNQLIVSSTDFYAKREHLKHLSGKLKLPFSYEILNTLPIMSIINEEMKTLYCIKPLVGWGDALMDGAKRPQIFPLGNVTDEVRDLITLVFFEKETIEVEYQYRGAFERTLYFLNSNSEILDNLKKMTSDQRDLLQEINFQDYLKSMNYHSLELEDSEYIGYSGFEKVVEIHSIAHLMTSDTGTQWPFYGTPRVML